MPGETDEQIDQVQAATALLKAVLGDALVAMYLHGSAASGKLRPQSDIDLLAVADGDLTADARCVRCGTVSRISAGAGLPARRGGFESGG